MALCWQGLLECPTGGKSLEASHMMNCGASDWLVPHNLCLLFKPLGEVLIPYQHSPAPAFLPHHTTFFIHLHMSTPCPDADFFCPKICRLDSNALAPYSESLVQNFGFIQSDSKVCACC
jgi:hypothetical protein